MGKINYAFCCGCITLVICIFTLLVITNIHRNESKSYDQRIIFELKTTKK